MSVHLEILTVGIGMPFLSFGELRMSPESQQVYVCDNSNSGPLARTLLSTVSAAASQGGVREVIFPWAVPCELLIP